MTEPDDQFTGSEAQESTPCHSDRHIEVDIGNGRDDDSIDDGSIADDGKAADAKTADAGKRNKQMILSQKGRKKLDTNTPAKEMVEILKQNASLRKQQYEEKTIQQNKVHKIPSVLETMDDTDMFFLSMAKMTKKLPKVEQARIKLALSNSVLSAEIKCNEQLILSTSPNQTFTQHNPTRQQSYTPLTSASDNLSYASDYSNSAENNYYERPTILEMVSLPNITQYNTNDMT